MGNTFFLKVARCKRCGGVLTDDESIKRGYGPSCYKNKDELKEIKRDFTKENDVGEQVTIFDILGD